jgi:hypothetical protein
MSFKQTQKKMNITANNDCPTNHALYVVTLKIETSCKCMLKVGTCSVRGVCGFPKPQECGDGRQVLITGCESSFPV